jgi:8-oxo-dGTP pyrophosphatase MutT (NUDIX family)
MQVIYTKQPIPASFDKSIFLAGPSPRRPEEPTWRPAALAYLRQAGYDGVVFIPEYESWEIDGESMFDKDGVPEWERECLTLSDNILFWVDRDLATKRYGLTTNLEFGEWAPSGKAVFGYRPGADKIDAMIERATIYNVPVYQDLEEAVNYIVQSQGDGSLRNGGERCIPLELWKTQSFQSWLQSHHSVGNELRKASIEWLFRVGPKNVLFLWIIHAHVWIKAEDRIKDNEVVVGRPDISTVLLYFPAKDPEIVLIKEFRSPVSNEEGYVYELPGGSSFKPTDDWTELAAEEVKEETGLELKPVRFHLEGTRQLASTLSAHKSHLFCAEIAIDELEKLKNDVEIHGNIEDTERTKIVVKKLSEIRQENLVDWSQLGMILSVVDWCL